MKSSISSLIAYVRKLNITFITCCAVIPSNSICLGSSSMLVYIIYINFCNTCVCSIIKSYFSSSWVSITCSCIKFVKISWINSIYAISYKCYPDFISIWKTTCTIYMNQCSLAITSSICYCCCYIVDCPCIKSSCFSNSNSTSICIISSIVIPSLYPCRDVCSIIVYVIYICCSYWCYCCIIKSNLTSTRVSIGSSSWICH